MNTIGLTWFLSASFVGILVTQFTDSGIINLIHTLVQLGYFFFIILKIYDIECPRCHNTIPQTFKTSIEKKCLNCGLPFDETVSENDIDSSNL